MPAPILKFFDFGHLPKHLKTVSREFNYLAYYLDNTLPDGAEKSVGLRKLLEAKDCFVRAALERKREVEEDTPEPRIFIHADAATDGMHCICGGPDYREASLGVMGYLGPMIQEMISRGEVVSEEVSISLRMMTDQEVEAIPEL